MSLGALLRAAGGTCGNGAGLLRALGAAAAGSGTATCQALGFAGTQSSAAWQGAAARASSTAVFADQGYVTLNALSPADGSHAKRRRVGRGIGCSKGKTCGRGHKGQHSRVGTGKPRKLFEGGANPQSERFPKYGFKNINARRYAPVNVADVAELVRKGALDASAPITMRALWEAGLVDKKLYNYDGVKLLGRGAASAELPKLDVEVTQVSESAREAIESAGGAVKRVYYNKLGLRAHLRPEWFVQKGRLVPRQVRQLPIGRADKFDALGHIDPDPRRDGADVALTSAKLADALAAHAEGIAAKKARDARRAEKRAAALARMRGTRGA